MRRSPQESGAGGTLVSVVLTTRDRPRLFAVALACYSNQTYPHRELIVVDDGDHFPVDPEIVAAAGGRLIRVATGTILGAKLNAGFAEARGALCQKMDDDDWYSPAFLETMVETLKRSQRVVCRPSLLFVSPFLFFDVARWEIRRSIRNNAPGATLMFAREDWERRPFRALPQDEDVWFYQDHTAMGSTTVPVSDSKIFLAVRHAGSQSDRDHTWTHQEDGRTMEEYLLDRPLLHRPEDLLPEWALAVYRDLRQELLSVQA
jgi:glycosyltransferase involved in cell wall biosynthesis